jgi:hypothetical protein
MLKTYVRRIVNNLFQKSKYKTSSFSDYSEYIKIQWLSSSILSDMVT